MPAVDPDSVLSHANGAIGLAGVWLEAGPELAPLLLQLGARACGDSAQVAGRWGQRFALANGQVMLLPIAHPAAPPRVIGVALRTASNHPSRQAVAVLPNFWIAYGIE